MSGAARLIGVDDTTVSRRLSALQSAAGTPLYQRRRDGLLQLTASGEAIAAQVEAMEHRIDLIGEALGPAHESCAGSVRVTSVPILVNRLFTPEIGELIDAHPRLDIELIPDSRDLSLTRREADVAIRLGRPATGGTHVKARRIGYLEYSIFAPRDLSLSEAASLPWITYDESMAHIPQARWIAKITSGDTARISGLRVHDAETAFEAVIAGLGKTLLPDVIADRNEHLRRLNIEEEPAPPSREIWLLAHADQLELRRIVTVVRWIEKVVTAIA